MIPQQLRLKNFFSYREATLDFRGLHTACICGENGAGKSSLLEAIAWSVWGKSRAVSEDDVIHVGENEAQVDFTFQSQQQIYRVIRRRRRGQSSVLEFQVETPTGFRSLTAKGLRATQQNLLDYLKLDYDTFINSAYLRQGRADEFMLRSPKERKQILADLLKLDHYEELSKQAKDMANQTKGQVTLLKQSLESLNIQLQQDGDLAQEFAQTEATVAQLQEQHDGDRVTLEQLQTQQNQRQAWLQQQEWHHQQLDNLHQEKERTQQELSSTQHQQQELEKWLQQDAEITQGHEQFKNLQGEEDTLATKFSAFQDAQNRRMSLQQTLTQQAAELQRQQQQAEAQLEALQQQEQDLTRILSKSAEVETALVESQKARDRLAALDELQTQVTPLMQQRLQLQAELDRSTAHLNARLEQLQGQQASLSAQHSQTAQLQQALTQVTAQIEELEKVQVYRQRVHEKGLERRSFIDRLKAHQRDYEAQLEEMDRKIQMLQVPDALCPLCDRPLDEQHWDLVSQKHQKQHQELLHQLWVTKEQLAVSEQEIKVLRQEYSELSHQLAGYETLRESRGQVLAQLDGCHRDWQTLQQIEAEQAKIARSLEAGEYALEIRSQLRQIESELQQLNYNEKDHALARGLVERWRWAEIKQAELRNAQKQQGQLEAQRPELEYRISKLQQKLEQLHSESDLAHQIADLDRYTANLHYNLEEHNAVRAALREAQVWLRRLEELRLAKQQYPQVQQRLGALAENVQRHDRDSEMLRSQLATVQQQLGETPDRRDDIAAIEPQIRQKRQQLDAAIAQLGRLQQQQQQLQVLKDQYEQLQQQLQGANRQMRVYQELSQAFGKNGIQALTIENVLPELEAETNRILSRLSANQLHVQFVTQRTSKGSKKSAKLIDTLEISIADTRGTRPYETYSGGEAFRINFAVRLALARLLAQRSGTALQMLIVDEGFGTQDDRGCERLISAINAIASEFACILTVTHIPHLKEAFQARIEVRKTENGSQLQLSI